MEILQPPFDRSPISIEKICHLAAESEEEILSKKTSFKDFAKRLTQRKRYKKSFFDE